MLRTSEGMLLIQSMPRVPYVYLQMPIGWNWLVMPIIVYVCIHLGRGFFKARGVKKDFIPDMIKIELTNIPIKSGTVYPDVGCLPGMLMLSGVELCGIQLWLNGSLSKNNQKFCLEKYSTIN